MIHSTLCAIWRSVMCVTIKAKQDMTLDLLCYINAEMRHETLCDI